MGTHLARQLQRYYTKERNKTVFRNRMTLTRLAWEIDVDPGFLSKVINGKDNRLFSHTQYEAFCKVVGLTSEERWDLEYALQKDCRQKHGLETDPSVPPHLLEVVMDYLGTIYHLSIQGKSPLGREMAEALYNQIKDITLPDAPITSSQLPQAIFSLMPHQTAVLFAATRHERFSPNELYRYLIPGPAGTPVLDRTIIDPSFNSISGLAFSPSGELFVTNVSPSYHQGSISRLLDATGTPSFNGTIMSSKFTSPVGVVVFNDKLFVAQRMSSDVVHFTIDTARDITTFSGAITEGLSSEAPRNVTVSPAGNELFVTECDSINEVNRYLFNGSGNFIMNGVIRGGGLSNPHSMAFSPWGELFVANAGNNSVSRFVFDTLGNAIPNGQITGPTLIVPGGLDFSPWGELFVGNHYGSGGISRWLFDVSHNAIPNGFFTTPHTLADIKFSPVLSPRPAGLMVNITAILAQASDSLQPNATHAGDYVSDLIRKNVAS